MKTKEIGLKIWTNNRIHEYDRNCNRNKTKANFIEVMTQGFSKRIYMNIFYIINQDIRIYYIYMLLYKNTKIKYRAEFLWVEP